MAIPDNNDMLSLLMQQQENSKVLKPPEGSISENCPWLFEAGYFQWDLCITSSLKPNCDDWITILFTPGQYVMLLKVS